MISEIAQRIANEGGFALIADYGHCGEKSDTFRVSKLLLLSSRWISCSFFNYLFSLLVSFSCLIRRSLDIHAAHALVRALIHSRLDYCNGVLAGLSLEKYRRLQSIMKASARLVLRLPSYASVTQLMHDRLYWLDVPQRIKYKLCVLTFKCIHKSAPGYLSRHCTSMSSLPGRSQLRSAAAGQLVVPFSKTKTLGDKGFVISGPSTWNSLFQSFMIKPCLCSLSKSIWKLFCFKLNELSCSSCSFIHYLSNFDSKLPNGQQVCSLPFRDGLPLESICLIIIIIIVLFQIYCFIFSFLILTVLSTSIFKLYSLFSHSFFLDLFVLLLNFLLSTSFEQTCFSSVLHCRPFEVTNCSIHCVSPERPTWQLMSILLLSRKWLKIKVFSEFYILEFTFC